MDIDYSTLLPFVKKHMPEILTGIGTAGMIFTCIDAVRRTPEALCRIEAYREEVGRYKLTPGEMIRTAWKVYISPVITGVASTTCILCGMSQGARRTASLAAAYVLSDTELSEYKEKTAELLGEEKTKEIEKAVVEDRMKKEPPENKQVLLVGNGDICVYDSINGRKFWSTINKLEKAVNNLNRRLNAEDYVSLNDFYYELGLNETKIGDDLGWNINDGLVELNYSSILDENGTPCLALDYRIRPKYNFLR